MRDEELDLIAALAAGDLDPAAVAEAEALLARDGPYLEEYQAQRLARDVLAEVAPARMTDLERAHMHRAVLDEVAAPSQKEGPSGALRWLRPLAVAAAAVAVVGFGGIMLAGTGDGGDPAAIFSTMDADEPAPASTTVPAGSEEVAAAPVEDEDALRDFADEGASQSLQSVESTARSLDLGSVNSRDIDDQYLTDIYLGAAQFTVEAPGNLSDTLLSCAPTAGELSDEPLLAFGTASYDGRAAQYFGFVSRRLIFLDVEDCSVLGEHPEP